MSLYFFLFKIIIFLIGINARFAEKIEKDMFIKHITKINRKFAIFIIITQKEWFF